MLEQQNYAHVSTYVFKAEAALDIPQAGAEKEKEKEKEKKKTAGSTANPEREKIQSKLDLALGLSMLGQSNYERAAWSFLKVGKNLDDWIGKVRCAHISLSRSNTSPDRSFLPLILPRTASSAPLLPLPDPPSKRL